MIPEAKAIKLVEIYCFLEKKYCEKHQYCCQRFSNKNKPSRSDMEVLTIYLFAINQERRFEIKEIQLCPPLLERLVSEAWLLTID